MEDLLIWGIENYGALALGALASIVALGIKHMLGARHGFLGDIVYRAGDEVMSAVKEVHQVFIDELKKARADGKLTSEEKQQARDMAIAIAKSNLGAKGLKRLAKALGLGDVNSWLGNRVEESVADLKLRAAGK